MAPYYRLSVSPDCYLRPLLRAHHRPPVLDDCDHRPLLRAPHRPPILHHLPERGTRPATLWPQPSDWVAMCEQMKTMQADQKKQQRVTNKLTRDARNMQETIEAATFIHNRGSRSHNRDLEKRVGRIEELLAKDRLDIDYLMEENTKTTQEIDHLKAENAETANQIASLKEAQVSAFGSRQVRCVHQGQ
ncbi:hypothetical protein HDV00_009359 [Rhizophlyctis rosea]|nr:hypothetical protein HDV00_009359 [Rhizophlyctis rosea]